jgi:hypothetical protein
MQSFRGISPTHVGKDEQRLRFSLRIDCPVVSVRTRGYYTRESDDERKEYSNYVEAAMQWVTLCSAGRGAAKSVISSLQFASALKSKSFWQSF